MTDVVFTGKCEIDGRHITRDQLCDLATRAGYRIHDKVGPHVDVLAASRTDTSKARAARDYGVTATLYADFIRRACEDALARGRDIPVFVPGYLRPQSAPPRSLGPVTADPNEVTRFQDGTFGYGGRVYATHTEAVQAVGRANREREGLNAPPPREIVRHSSMTYEIDRRTGRVYWNNRIVTGLRAHDDGRFTYNGRFYGSLTDALFARSDAVVDPDVLPERLPDAVREASSPNRTPVHHLKVRFFNGEERWIESVEMLERLRAIDPRTQIVGGTAADRHIHVAEVAPPQDHSIASPGRRAIIWDD